LLEVNNLPLAAQKAGMVKLVDISRSRAGSRKAQKVFLNCGYGEIDGHIPLTSGEPQGIESFFELRVW